MNDASHCRCDTFVHPQMIRNLPGRAQIAYRIGDYTAFRHALLLSLPAEIELANWKPTGTSDLALQMVEWWAYLADILTFYNEHIANEDYLRTASLDESVKHIIRLLGYRPRPGIGATATLAAISTAKKPFTLPQGFAVQSKPGPGSQPQIFELDAPAAVQPLSEVSADALPDATTLGADGTVLLRGTVSSIKQGDRLLVVARNWNGTDSKYAYRTVDTANPETDPRGSQNTRVKFTAALGLPDGASPANYRLLRSTQTTRLWQYAGADQALVENGNGSSTVELESAVRSLTPGDMILFDAGLKSLLGVDEVTTFESASSVHFLARSAPSVLNLESAASGLQRSLPIGIGFVPDVQLSSVITYSEVIWYANANDTSPATPPTDTPGIAILHSELTVRPAFSTSKTKALIIRYGWQDVGQLIPTPASSFNAGNPELIAVDSDFPAGSTPVLLEDANGDGESATGFVGPALTAMQLSNLPNDPSSLATPVGVLFNLLEMSRGKSVKGEVLGSGDSSLASQQFVLQKSPLTYLMSADSSSGANYKSTLTVWVNGFEWSEVPSFYGQKPAATIFVTREDDNNRTHVQFGDGVNGARLPSGANNVVANYRFGSGADAPAAGKLTTIVSAQPGLASVRNPVAASGGADPDPASQIRRYAPLSVLTFGRAVSGEDYEAIAASTPGVARAHAYWSFDFLRQRTTVTVYVGDNEGAVNAARIALRGDADPNRPVVVKMATAIAVHIALTLVVDPRYVSGDLVSAVQQSLLDRQNGLFGAERIGIGEVIYASEIYQACLSVPGTIAVHDLNVRIGDSPSSLSTKHHFLLGTSVSASTFHLLKRLLRGTSYRFDPGEGSYFSLDAGALAVTAAGSHE